MVPGVGHCAIRCRPAFIPSLGGGCEWSYHPSFTHEESEAQREVKFFGQGHPGCKWSSWDLDHFVYLLRPSSAFFVGKAYVSFYLQSLTSSRFSYDLNKELSVLKLFHLSYCILMSPNLSSRTLCYFPSISTWIFFPVPQNPHLNTLLSLPQIYSNEGSMMKYIHISFLYLLLFSSKILELNGFCS